jgi:hypothetical protein
LKRPSDDYERVASESELLTAHAHHH